MIQWLGDSIFTLFGLGVGDAERVVIISRGSAGAQPPQPRAGPFPSAGPASFQLVHHRLAALERLAQLHEKGVLTKAEFAGEKALVLRLPADEPAPRPAAVRRARGPSLLGRMLDWRLLAAGLALGLGVSFYAQPQELQTLANRSAAWLG